MAKKVLRIINRFNIGGITYNVSYLSKYLEPDFETLLVGGPEEEGEDSSLYIPQNLGLKPLVLKQFQREINFKADYAAYKEIKKIIRAYFLLEPLDLGCGVPKKSGSSLKNTPMYL